MDTICSSSRSAKRSMPVLVRLRRIYHFAVCIFYFAIPYNVDAAVDVQSLVDGVSPDSIEASLRRLVGFETRFMGSDSSAAAATWLRSRLQSFDYGVRLDSFVINVSRRVGGQTFLLQGVDEVNVLAEKQGRLSDRYVIVGGHFDSISLDRTPGTQDVAPGADDNASGVAAVLEIARILSQVELDATVIFAFWGAEELGLIGSSHFASQARARGDSIRVMFQLDSIGTRFGDFPEAFTIETVSRYVPQARALSDAAREFSDVRSRNNVGDDLFITTGGCQCSDHQSFIDNGFPGIGVFQYFWNPENHINTSRDSLGIVDIELVSNIARAVAGAVVQAAGERTPTADFDRNGTVDFDDFLLFAVVFGSPVTDETTASFDLDGDGFVGFSDFLEFVTHFGKSP